MHPLPFDEYEASDEPLISETTIICLGVAGAFINLGMIVATVMFMPEIHKNDVVPNTPAGLTITNLWNKKLTAMRGA